MLISYNWLKKYFTEELPPAEEIAEQLIFHSFEVEDLVEKNSDFLLEVKILPDRAHDCLCHYGIAKEIGALFNLSVKKPTEGLKEFKIEGTKRDLKIKIEDEKLCRRYIGRVIENIEIKESSTWLQQILKNLDQRAISNVVDAANYLMFDVGQPVHTFDADKVKGDILVRRAKSGESFVTLDDKAVTLDDSILVIADDEGPLAIAGIKGGKRAEVDRKTKNLILEVANFDPVSVRKTAFRVGIRTDASKRYENELSTALGDYAIDLLTDLIIKEAGTSETKIGDKIDEYKNKDLPISIEFTIKTITERLGVDIPVEESANILNRLGIQTEIVGDKFKVVPPVERLDLQAKENYVEEVGRIYGYDKIAAKLPIELKKGTIFSEAEKRFNLSNRIRVILKAEGFTEVYGYTFTNKGEVELANPLASDKAFLRTDLADWLKDKITTNLPYILFDDEAIKVFEIGEVFTGNKEETHFALGVSYRKKIKNHDPEIEVNEVVKKLFTELGIESQKSIRTEKIPEGLIVELNFDNLASSLENIVPTKIDEVVNLKAVYKQISPYPRIIRDVAVWVPEATAEETVAELIKKSAGNLCVEGPILFDEFSKEGRKSLAFRLVFQSYEKTLSDSEANDQMSKVIANLEKQTGFEVRK